MFKNHIPFHNFIKLISLLSSSMQLSSNMHIFKGSPIQASIGPKHEALTSSVHFIILNYTIPNCKTQANNKFHITHEFNFYHLFYFFKDVHHANVSFIVLPLGRTLYPTFLVYSCKSSFS